MILTKPTPYNLPRLLTWCCLGLFLISSAACRERSEPARKAAPATQEELDASAAQDTAFYIIPGEHIGQIRLSMQPEEVHNTLGDPDFSEAAMGKAKQTWYSAATDSPRHQVDVYTVRQRTGEPDEVVEVDQVRVTSPSFTIPRMRISPGSRLTKIQQYFPNLQAVAYYPTPKQGRVYVYDDRVGGIAFELTGPDSVCVGITVHPKGRGVEQAPIPLQDGMVRLRQQ